MFRMSHDAVDFFSADFTAAGVIVAGRSTRWDILRRRRWRCRGSSPWI